MAFWITVSLLLAIAAFFVLRPLVTSRIAATSPEGTKDVQVYRDQLREVNREIELGRLAAADGEQLRLEISRRLLEADARQNTATVQRGRGFSRTMALGAGLFIVLASLGLYLQFGAPNVLDQPLTEQMATRDAAIAARPSQEEVEQQRTDTKDTESSADPAYLALTEKLRQVVAARPNDLAGLELLATHEANLGNFAAAWRAKARAIEQKGEAAVAKDYTDLSELMIAAAGGYVSPKAQSALAMVLQKTPRDPRARYFTGLALAQNGRPDLTRNIWEDLMREGPDDAAWVQAIKVQLPELLRLNGMSDDVDPAGPSKGDIENAKDLSDQERSALIRRMVEQLSERLATEGGSPDEWARLIRALGVLGELPRARAIWVEASGVFSENPDALEIINTAALKAWLER